jgi:hypothetical protein
MRTFDIFGAPALVLGILLSACLPGETTLLPPAKVLPKSSVSGNLHLLQGHQLLAVERDPQGGVTQSQAKSMLRLNPRTGAIAGGEEISRGEEGIKLRVNDANIALLDAYIGHINDLLPVGYSELILSGWVARTIGIHRSQRKRGSKCRPTLHTSRIETSVDGLEHEQASSTSPKGSSRRHSLGAGESHGGSRFVPRSHHRKADRGCRGGGPIESVYR